MTNVGERKISQLDILQTWQKRDLKNVFVFADTC